MDKLHEELQRLHFLAEEDVASGRRMLCLAFTHAADWESAASTWSAVQAEFELPPPAVSVDGKGYRLWFSFAEPLDAETAARFLNGLHAACLAEIPASRLCFAPDDKLPPCELAGDERWAAFIDPSLGSMFIAEPWLDMAPNRNQQAELLAACHPIPTTDFCRVLACMSSGPQEPQAPETTAETLSMQQTFSDPRSFLLAVMNDPQTATALRIEAAKALLPHSGK